MGNIAEQIWKECHNELKGYIMKKVADLSTAEDILQEVFVKIIDNTDKVKKAKNMQQYIYGITRNAVNDHFRLSKAVTEFDEDIPLTEEDILTLNDSIAECCLMSFVNQLPEKYRHALVKTELEHIPQKELAKELQISYSGAKSRVQRGKEKLREIILACCNYQYDKYGNLMEPLDKTN